MLSPTMLRRFLPQLYHTCLRSHANAATAAITQQLEQTHIDEAIKLQPSLKCMSPQLWQRAHQTFHNHGITTTSFLQIVVSNPTILSRSPQKIIESMEHWRSCQFGEKLLHMLITKFPELLDVQDGHLIRNHFAYLKTFAGTSKNVWKLLMNCPNLMEQSEQKIEQKIEYLTQTMRLEMPEIIKSEALSKSLEEIRCRHVFLQRLGLFTPRPLKADPNEPTKNHRIYKITDTSEKTFATKVCHVSLMEYEAFKLLYEKELEKKRKQLQEDEDEDEFSD